MYWPQVKGFIETAIYDGNSVGPASMIGGPAILEFPTTTILVPPDWHCRSNEFGSLTLNIASKKQEGQHQ